MKLDNRAFIIRQNILKFVVLLIYATIMSVIVFTGTLELLFGYTDKITISVVISFAYLFFLMYNYNIDYNYISFSDEGTKFIFHFVSSRPLNKRPKAIEILKTKFGGYKIEKSFFGKKKEIVISVKTQNGIAKYPPINISALTKSQVIILTNSLKQHA